MVMSLGLGRGNLSRRSGSFEFGVAVPVVVSTALVTAAEANQLPFSGKMSLVITDIDWLFTARTPNVQHFPNPFYLETFYLGAPSFVCGESIGKRAKDFKSCWLLASSC